jgi:hypothetical protein
MAYVWGMERKTLKVNDKVLIKMGSHKDKTGTITLIAQINNVKRYYVERENQTVAWYSYHQIGRVKNGK